MVSYQTEKRDMPQDSILNPALVNIFYLTWTKKKSGVTVLDELLETLFCFGQTPM